MKLRNKLMTVAAMGMMAFSAGKVNAATTKSQRRLVVVSNLKTFGQARYEWLYSFLDASTISVAQAMLGGSYEKIYALHPSVASRSNFRSHLKAITNKSDVKAVDVILSLHGADEKIWFKDGKENMSDIEADLKTIQNRNKLRMMYNLACYGESHRGDFVRGGFRTAIGARKTNTSSATEYPEFLSRFAGGHSVRDIINSTNANPGLAASDWMAGTMGFSDADSTKVILGTSTLKMNYNAQ